MRGDASRPSLCPRSAGRSQAGGPMVQQWGGVGAAQCGGHGPWSLAWCDWVQWLLLLWQPHTALALLLLPTTPGHRELGLKPPVPSSPSAPISGPKHPWGFWPLDGHNRWLTPNLASAGASRVLGKDVSRGQGHCCSINAAAVERTNVGESVQATA